MIRIVLFEAGTFTKNKTYMKILIYCGKIENLQILDFRARGLVFGVNFLEISFQLAFLNSKIASLFFYLEIYLLPSVLSSIFLANIFSSSSFVHCLPPDLLGAD